MSEYGQLDLLQHEFMTGIVEEFPTPDFKGRQFFPSNPVLSNMSKWDIVQKNRGMAEFSVPGAPAKIVARRAVSQQTATQTYIREKKQLKGETMAWLRKPGTEHQQYKEQAVADELFELDSRLEYRKEWLRWQGFTGTITYAADDVKFVIDTRIDGTHKVTAAVTWATSTTDICGDIATWKRLIEKDSMKPCTQAWANDVVMSYIQKNDYVKDKFGDMIKDQIAKEGYIKRFMGIDWNWYNTGYVDGGTFYPFIANDYIVFMAATGSFGRTDEGPATDPKANFKPGKFAKSWEEEDPAGVWVLEEESSLPIITIPNAIVYADTTT